MVKVYFRDGRVAELQAVKFYCENGILNVINSSGRAVGLFAPGVWDYAVVSRNG